MKEMKEEQTEFMSTNPHPGKIQRSLVSRAPVVSSITPDPNPTSCVPLPSGTKDNFHTLMYKILWQSMYCFAFIGQIKRLRLADWKQDEKV